MLHFKDLISVEDLSAIRNQLVFYNTLVRQLVSFKPINDNVIKVYVCGLTVYAYPHLGNMRPCLHFDILVRFLKVLFPEVIYVRNITDVDDKINNRAQKLGIDVFDLTHDVIAIFHTITKKLNLLQPNYEPKVTAHIPDIISMIRDMLNSETAYISQGHVFFDITKYPDYGIFANRDFKSLLHGARVEVVAYKKNPGDFVLWKPSEPPIVGWNSPFGYGRPGWHIECSAMMHKYLGVEIDIHGGGIDLVFPHHQNEIAQSYACHHVIPARYWLHSGMLKIDNKKMSKSKGTTISIKDVLNDHPHSGNILRLTFLNTHYRHPLNFSWDKLENISKIWHNWHNTLSNSEYNSSGIQIPVEIWQFLAKDLNTPGLMAVLHKYFKKMKQNTDNKLYYGRILRKVLEFLGFEFHSS